MRHARPGLACASLLAVIVAIAGCLSSSTQPDRRRQGTGAPNFEISDGAHGGTARFFFLPPLVPFPSTTGVFDPTRRPVVEICELVGADCAIDASGQAVLLASFSTSGPAGSETVKVSTTDDQYLLNWHTDQSTLSTEKIYRIRVRLDGFQLGYVDIQPVANAGQLKNRNSGDIISLVDGRTLPIKFRIEQGVLCDVADCAEQIIGSEGGLVVVPSGLAAVRIPGGAVDHPIRFSVRRKGDACMPGAALVAGPCFEVTTDQGPDFTLSAPATVAICPAEPAADATLQKFDPSHPDRGVILLAKVSAVFLDCGIGVIPAGGSTTSFSVYLPTVSSLWGSVTLDAPRAEPSVTPLVAPSTVAPYCENPFTLAIHTGQNAGQLLVAGGLDNDQMPLASAVLFSAVRRSTSDADGVDLNRVWTGSMNVARWAHTATELLNGNVLVAGGVGAAGPLADAELFTGSGFVRVGPMTMPRVRPTATLLADGRVLITGGLTSSIVATPTAEVFDPATGQFTAAGSMIVPRQRHRATFIPNTGQVLITGGDGSGGNPPASRPVVTARIELFTPSPTGGSFSLVGAMQVPRRSHSATYLPYLSRSQSTAYVLVAGGTDNSIVHESSEILQITAGQVSSSYLQPMPGVQGHQATIGGGCSLLITGGTTDVQSNLPASGGVVPSAMSLWYRAAPLNAPPGSWSRATDMPFPRTLHRVANLPTNRFVLIGGITGFSAPGVPVPAASYDIMAWSGRVP